MSKPRLLYVCQACGAMQARWVGKCPDCGEWNTIIEEQVMGEGEHQRATLTAIHRQRVVLSHDARLVLSAKAPPARSPTRLRFDHTTILGACGQRCDVIVMVLRDPISPCRDDSQLHVSHITLTDRVDAETPKGMPWA